MHQFEEINKSMLQNLLHHCNSKNSKNIFMFLLEELNENYYLSLLLDADILEKSVLALDCLESDEEIAKVVNSILGIMYNIEYDYRNNKNYIDILLKSYLEIMDRGYFYIKNIKDTLFLFSELGIKKEYLVREIIKRYDEESCIAIFWEAGYHLDKLDVQIDPKYQFLLEKKRKLSTRFGLIFHFYLMTEKDYIENIEIAGNYFKIYHNHMTTCADWGFSSNLRAYSYVEDGIISKEEEAIFAEIGDLYYDCMEEREPSDLEENELSIRELGEKEVDEELEELFDRLRVASAQFAAQLKTKKVQDLLNQFFHGKSVFEVAFHLPDKKETDNIL